MANKRKDEPLLPASTTIPESLRNAIETRAKAQERTFAQILRKYIALGYETEKQNQKAA